MLILIPISALQAADARLTEEMTSSKMTVAFDSATQEPRVITNRETNGSLTLVPESAFRLELDRLEGTAVPAELAGRPPAVIIDAQQCQIVSADQQETAEKGLVRSIVYESPQGRIVIDYTLGREDHFLQKHIRFMPAFPESYLLRRVCTQQFRFSERPASLVAFQHGRCLTHFVRGEQTGFFFGVQVPLEVKVEHPEASVELAYDVNYRYPANAEYAAETVFWGVCKPSGKFAPPVKALIDECQNSEIPPDLAESAAMLAMVRRLTHPLQHAVTVNYNSWEGKLSRKGYGTGATAEDVEQDKKVLTLAQEQFGEFYTCLAIPWGGMGFDMSKLGAEAKEPLTSDLQRELLDWAHQNGIRLHTWAPIKAICPWLGVHRYCPNHEAWWGKHNLDEYNCPCNREFMDWYTRLMVAQVRRDGFQGYALDELGPAPRTELPCHATGHDHLPGNATYGYFVARRELYRTLRKEFGEDFHLEAARPNMDTGVWDLLYADYVFTLSEGETPGGDEVRYRSRVRHFYHFFSSTMDQIYFKPNATDNIDYLILSALAVSNRHCVHGVGRDEAERKRIRYWYDWARERPEMMLNQTIFLPDWLGGGKCDSYVRLDTKGGGYAFVFNANDESVEMEFPLNEVSGLFADKDYHLRSELSESSKAWIARDSTSLTVPAKQVVLLSIQPVPSR